MSCAPDNTLYAEFVGKVAERYKDYTNYLQIWNEPYADQYYWGGNAKTYADMLRKAGAAAKEKNPSAKICAGAAWDEVFSPPAAVTISGLFTVIPKWGRCTN
ncbi:MAG: hypothetical protein L6W00_01805 [Lentisphaeria bacterium]|nr:MAG: hypothetical protein L6W00_01805 [Lentisphaeria bacterium]